MTYPSHIYVCFRSELAVLYQKGVILAGYACAYSCYPIVSSFVALFPFIMDGNHLTPQNVFTTLALLGALQKQVTVIFGYELRALFQAAMTLERIESFLLEDTSDETHSFNKANDSGHSKLESDNVHRNICNAKLRKQLQCHDEQTPLTSHVCNQDKPFLCLSNVQFRPWDESGELNLCISNTPLIGITGPVGCGKSSFFNTIIDEVPLASGQIAHQGRIAYVCQTPWVFSGTIRENIVFGEQYNYEAFQRAVEVCSLKEDLASLPSGDMTHVGERGVSLSGGQRARVNLARAVYFNADIYLLDDPLSSVDIKVSNELFDRCICGALSGRIRLLITHQPFRLQNTDLVLSMNKDGELTQGTFTELYESRNFPYVATLMSPEKASEDFPSSLATYKKACVTDIHNSSGLEIEDEDRLIGSVSYLTYWKYLAYGVSKLSMFFMGILLLLPEGKYYQFVLFVIGMA